MKSFFKVASISSLVFALGACASMTKQKDDVALNEVKTVAVVAVSAIEPASRELGFDLGSGKLGGEAGGSMIPKNAPHVDRMLAELRKTLARNMGWKVMSFKKMKAHPSYRRAYKATMEGWQNKMPVGQGQQQFNVKGVMDFDGPRILDQAGRNKLIRELGVDAIVVARINTVLHGTTVMGIGTRYPKTSVHLNVYNQRNERPIWFETFHGEKAEQSVGKTGFIDEKLMGRLAVDSAQTAFQQIRKTTVQ